MVSTSIISPRFLQAAWFQGTGQPFRQGKRLIAQISTCLAGAEAPLPQESLDGHRIAGSRLIAPQTIRKSGRRSGRAGRQGQAEPCALPGQGQHSRRELALRDLLSSPQIL